MLHFTIDGFRGFRSRFDDAHLIQEVLEDAPAQLGLRRAMPAFVLPYYNGVVPEDCGISAFVFLAGGHFTLHTFSFRETYFADLVAPDDFDAAKLRALLEAVFPCAITRVRTVARQVLMDSEPDVENDFRPHLFLNVDAYQGPQSLDALFDVFDRLPAPVGMTPIRPTREPMTVAHDSHGGSGLARLGRVRKLALQGPKLGEALEAWKRVVEGESLICLGSAGAVSSAGMWPLVT